MLCVAENCFHVDSVGQVSYIANLTSDPGSAAAKYFSTYYSAPGTAPPVGDGWHPKQKSYGQWDLLTDHDSYFMSSFIPQFNWFLSRGYQASHTGPGGNYNVQCSSHVSGESLLHSAGHRLAGGGPGLVGGKSAGGQRGLGGRGPGSNRNKKLTSVEIIPFVS